MRNEPAAEHLPCCKVRFVRNVPVFIGSDDDHPAELFAEQHSRLVGFGVVDDSFATPASMYLRFDDNGATPTCFEVVIGDHSSIFCGEDRLTVEQRNIELAKKLLGLVFVDIHRSTVQSGTKQ